MRAADVRPGDLIRVGGVGYVVLAAQHQGDCVWSDRHPSGRRRAKVVLHYRHSAEQSRQVSFDPEADVEVFPAPTEGQP